jgi:putative membrane protein
MRICWALGALWLALFLASVLTPPPLGDVLGAVQPLLLIVILLIHCSMLYGWRGVAAYVAIGLAVGFVLEASSVANGFPFGSYVHNEPGPKPLGVPISAMLAYAGFGWYAWTVARVIGLERPDRNDGWGRFTTPVIAAFVLAGFDYPYDPIGSSVLGMWTYKHPSGQFGVPLSNFLGWIFTGWVLFQIIALLEHRFRATAAARSRGFWLLPSLLWLAFGLRYPFLWAAAPRGTVTAAGRTFVIGDVYEAAVAASLFTLFFTGLLALVRCRQLGDFGAAAGTAGDR